MAFSQSLRSLADARAVRFDPKTVASEPACSDLKNDSSCFNSAVSSSARETACRGLDTSTREVPHTSRSSRTMRCSSRWSRTHRSCSTCVTFFALTRQPSTM